MATSATVNVSITAVAIVTEASDFAGVGNLIFRSVTP